MMIVAMMASFSSESFKTWTHQDPYVLFALSALLGLALLLIFRSFRTSQDSTSSTKRKATPAQVLELIQTRRSVSPKDYLDAEDDPVTEIELESLLEAANWAPTHERTEPWRFVVIAGMGPITDYLGQLEEWYTNMSASLPEEAMEKFRKKYSALSGIWPRKLSYLVLICLKRGGVKPEKRLPEWEELCAVAMAVQNFHLMASSLGLGVFWSSHTWCKDARDSVEIKERFGLHQEDRILGALTVGRYERTRVFKSTRVPISSKVSYIT